MKLKEFIEILEKMDQDIFVDQLINSIKDYFYKFNFKSEIKSIDDIEIIIEDKKIFIRNVTDNQKFMIRD